jgi:hypothetical protein
MAGQPYGHALMVDARLGPSATPALPQRARVYSASAVTTNPSRFRGASCISRPPARSVPDSQESPCRRDGRVVPATVRPLPLAPFTFAFRWRRSGPVCTPTHGGGGTSSPGKGTRRPNSDSVAWNIAHVYRRHWDADSRRRSLTATRHEHPYQSHYRQRRQRHCAAVSQTRHV